ncbi:MAG: HAMP domain-containing protein [Clostridia bacterium]|nr:HAMP domain-containing protein [Clostridia bacterium]
MKKQKFKEKIQNKRRKTKPLGRSIYFLLWAAFSVFSLVILLIVNGSQRVVLERTYQFELFKSVIEKGNYVSDTLEEPIPQKFQGDYNAFVRYLSSQNDADVYVISEDGKLVFPKENVSAPELEEEGHFDEKLIKLKEELALSEQEYAFFVADDGDYVYGKQIRLLDEDRYLYLEKSSALIQTVAERLNQRTLLIALFIFVASFAVASGLAGVLVKPLSEMGEKAKRLAAGDFEVDFKGESFAGEMEELAETLNYARDEIFKADKMQKELIANVSHDFKTPLTMIKAYASMIVEISGDDPEKRNKHAKVIIDEADRLASLVSDVLDISKIRSGISGLEIEKVDLSAYLGEILERFKYLSETQGYTFETEIESGLTVKADKVKIGQALYNLISNAVNYTGDDKRVIIRLKSYASGSFRFSVTDTGKGIKKEELESIWDRYYRSSEMHKRPVQGTGLGLSIVKTVLEKHKFVYGVESEEGKGSTFYVIFPEADK